MALASPFDYQNQAELLIPAMKYEPSAPQFTEYLIEILPKYLEDKKANLVLFSSYWQMNQVAEALSSEFIKRGWALQVQGESSRQEILKNIKSL